MRYLSFKTLSLLLLCTAVVFSANAQSKRKKNKKKKPNTTVVAETRKDTVTTVDLNLFKPKPKKEVKNSMDYPQIIEDITLLLKERMPKSALEKIAATKPTAKSDAQYGYFIKLIDFELAANMAMEEETESSEFKYQFFSKTLLSNPEPEIAAFIELRIAGILAEVFRGQKNRESDFNFNDTSNNISNWSPHKINQEINRHINQSLAAATLVNNLQVYEPIIGNYSKPEIPMTIHQILTYSAIEILTNIEENVAIDYQGPNSDLLMTDASAFLKSDFTNKIDPKNEFRIAQLIQTLVLSGNMYFDIKRLKYFQSKFSISNAVLENSLRKLLADKSSDGLANLLVFEIAQLISDKSPVEAVSMMEQALKDQPHYKDNYLLKNLIFNIQKPEYSIQTETLVAPNKKILAAITARNLDKINISVYAIDYFKHEKMNFNYYNKEQLKEIKTYINSLKLVKAESIKLPKFSDYKSHTFEIALPELANGYYFIVLNNMQEIEDSMNAIQTAKINVSDYVFVDQETIELKNANTGAAVVGEKYNLYKSFYNNVSGKYENKLISSGITNNLGRFNFPEVPVKEYSNSIVIEIPSQKSFYANTIYAKNGTRSEKEGQQHVIFTDRSIYRPGQTVYFKVLAYKQLAKVVIPKALITAKLFDNNYKEIAKLELNANELGAASGSFVLPQNAFNTGGFHITTYNGIVYFTVEEYKRPKYAAEIKVPEKAYKLNDEIELTGEAKAYAGYAIQDAKVEYTVTRKVRPVYYWWYFKGYNNNSETQTLLTQNTVTDKEGKFKINFKAIPDLKEKPETNPYFIYEVKATITDLNGEVRQCSYDLTLAYTDLQVNLSGSEKFMSGKDIELYYTATNLQVKIVKFSGDLVLNRIVKPSIPKRNRLWTIPDTSFISEKDFNSWFPDYAFNEKENLTQLMTKKIVNDSNGRWLINTKELSEAGDYSAILTAKDGNGKEIKSEFRFSILPTTAGKYTAQNVITVFPISSEDYEPGSTAKIILASSCKNVTVFFEVRSHRGTIKKENIVLNEESKIIEIPVTEKDRGNIKINVFTIYNYRKYQAEAMVKVPYSNKELNVKIASFRSDIEPGSKEKWTITLSGPKSEKAAMEALASMYDQSLDALHPEGNWGNSFFNSFDYSQYVYDNFGHQNFNEFIQINDRSLITPFIEIPCFYLWGLSGYNFEYSYNHNAWGFENNRNDRNNYRFLRKSNMKISYDMDASFAFGNEVDKSMKEGFVTGPGGGGKGLAPSKSNENNITSNIPPPIRKNFNETAFFLPHLKTNDKGEIVFEFTAPESLTKWKMRVFAHSTTLQTGYDEKLITTSKKLMVQPNMPRFLRQNDKISIGSKLVNTTSSPITSKVRFEIKDEITGKDLSWLISSNENTITVPANGTMPVSFTLQIPEYNGIVNLSVYASAGEFSDGEQHVLPVLSNRMLITESLPITIRKAETQDLIFNNLKNNKSTTLVNHKMSVEMCSNPAWYAVQALPYMMEFPHECAEQTFTRLYANALSQSLINSNPAIKSVYTEWEKEAAKGGESLQSKLLKNQDLKSTIIEETPWLREANSETERMKLLGNLFNMKKANSEIEIAWDKLMKMQSEDGGWSWFPGMRGNEYITQTIVIGFGKLKQMGINIGNYESSITNAIQFLDRKAKEDYEYYKAHADIKLVTATNLQYLYAKSYFPTYGTKISDEVLQFYIKNAEVNWASNSLINQAQLVVALKVLNPNSTLPTKIIQSFNENALNNKEMGMYWKQNSGGCNWYNSTIETQAAIIEAYKKMGGANDKIVDMLVWLMRQKQTQNWSTTRATADACYAILMNSNFTNNTQNIEIKINNAPITVEKKEAGTGYFRSDIAKENINASASAITVKSSTADFAYGAVYWQYFEDFDKINADGNGIKVVKKLYKVTNTATGKQTTEIKPGDVLKVGDIVEVSLTIISDRNLEFVHIKDGRASGSEPVDVLSEYKYQNGLWYYQSTRDASTNFFVDNLAKGTYQLNYTLKIEQTGIFNSGVATAQCMYAPEYTGHSKGIIVTVE